MATWKDEAKLNEYRKINASSPYGARVISYAEDWANLMEGRMAAGAELEDIAKDTAYEADTDGITGFMYGAAVATLSDCWIYGERLRKWHNRGIQIGTEGEEANASGGILNPAMMTITTPD